MTAFEFIFLCLVSSGFGIAITIHAYGVAATCSSMFFLCMFDALIDAIKEAK